MKTGLGDLTCAVPSGASTARYVWCCNNGCGECRTRMREFETLREESMDGTLLRRETVKERVSACCGAGLFLWDNEQDCEVPEEKAAALMAASTGADTERHGSNLPPGNGSPNQDDPAPVCAPLSAAPAGVQPVARLLKNIGRDPYPRGKVIARTYQECAENAYPDLWEEGEKLYTSPPTPASEAVAQDAERWRALRRNFGNERDEGAPGKPHDIQIRLNAVGCEVFNGDGTPNMGATLDAIMDDEIRIQSAALRNTQGERNG